MKKNHDAEQQRRKAKQKRERWDTGTEVVRGREQASVKVEKAKEGRLGTRKKHLTAW